MWSYLVTMWFISDGCQSVWGKIYWWKGLEASQHEYWIQPKCCSFNCQVCLIFNFMWRQIDFFKGLTDKYFSQFWVILRVKRNSNGQEIIRVLMLIFYFVGNVKCLYLIPRFINTKGLVDFSLAQWKLGCFWLPLLALIKSWYYGSTFWLFCNMIKANDIFTKTKNGQKQHPFSGPHQIKKPENIENIKGYYKPKN